jgi:hypothetical protein
METTKQGVVGLAFLATATYAIILFCYVVGFEFAQKLFVHNIPYTIGLPISAFASFSIICIFEKFAPSGTDAQGKVQFKAFGLEFSGPGGPVTLWVLCYLALVASTHFIKTG